MHLLTLPFFQRFALSPPVCWLKNWLSNWLNPLVWLVIPAMVLTGCGDGSNGGDEGLNATEPPVQAALVGNSYAIEIEGDDAMRYNINRFLVPAGVDLRLTLTVTGVMSREMMGHNWVLIGGETPVDIFAADAAGAFATDFIPAGWDESILAHTDLLGGQEQTTIVFKTPEQPGEYTYLCTFPGHYYAGMHGVMVVE